MFKKEQSQNRMKLLQIWKKHQLKMKNIIKKQIKII